MPEARVAELFRSEDLLVRGVTGFSQACCVVTFASFTDERTLEREGFGEAFFRAHAVDAVHVLTRTNTWYQYPEILDAMARVREAVAAYARVVTYGSSMGAYAALRLAGLVGAGCVLALSPQFSVRPGVARFEHRWVRDGADVWEEAVPVPQVPEAYVLYDPADLDTRHVALFAARAGIIPVRLPGAGHPVTGFLSELGMLQRMVLAACAGPLDVAAIEREGWERRQESPQYWCVLAARTRVAAWRLALLRRAAALAPAHVGVLTRLGLALGQAGAFAEALAAHRAALALNPAHPALLDDYATTLETSGDPLAATAALEQAAAQGEGVRYAPRLAGLRALASGEGGARVRGRDPGMAAGPLSPPVRTARGARGMALLGPHLPLTPGRYAVAFTMRAAKREAWRRLDWRNACTLDVAVYRGTLRLAQRRIPAWALRETDRVFELEFEMPEWTGCEFRAFATGVAGLVIQPTRVLRRL